MHDSGTLRMVIRILSVIGIILNTLGTSYRISEAKKQKTKNIHIIFCIFITVMYIFTIGLTYCR